MLTSLIEEKEKEFFSCTELQNFEELEKKVLFVVGVEKHSNDSTLKQTFKMYNTSSLNIWIS